MPIEVELPDGSIAEFPDDMAPEQIEAVLSAQFGAQPQEQQAPAEGPGIGQQALNAVGEFAAAANRQVFGLVDFVGPDTVNAALGAFGSDKRVPTLTETLGHPGGFMEPGLARDAVAGAGAAVPIGLGVGAALRGAAAKYLPQMASGAESIGAGILRQLGKTTAGADAALGAASGVGGAVGGAAGEEIAGEEGRRVGELAGAVLVPVGAAVGAAALASRAKKTADIAERLAQKRSDADLAEYKLQPIKGGQPPKDADVVEMPNGRRMAVVNDAEAAEAIKQGADRAVVSAMKSVNDPTRERLLRMTKISRQGKKDALFRDSNRPSDVVGGSLSARLRSVKAVNDKAGSRLDLVAKSLQGQKADMSAPAKRYAAALRDAGVTQGEKGTLNFRGSDFEDLAGVNKILNTVTRRAGHVFRTGDAYEAHRLKRFIDEQVSYGKGSADGLTGKSERMLKALRASIDEALDQQFPRYNKVNTQYSDSVRALDAFQDAAGTKIDLFGPNADSAIGTVSRRLLSNAQSRASLKDAIKQLDDTAAKYGAKFDDDIMAQVTFADELDRLFGAAARTSLQGDAEKAAGSAARIMTGQETPTGLAAKGIEAGIMKARGINEENAYKALIRLLARKSN